MSNVFNTYASMKLAREHGIQPEKCSRCGQAEGNWDFPTWDGTTQLTDSGDLIWQCRGCGNYDSLTAEQIRELAG